MSEQIIVTASLEGMRVVVTDTCCALEEYDFSVNRWLPKDEAPWPLPRALADQWISGWNNVDGSSALDALIGGL